MGGPGSGGQRVGRQGVAYGNRSDLNKLPIRTATGQTYGTATAQADAQRAVPLAPQPSISLPGPTSTPFNAPTQRPNEPVTSGLSTGPGPGPSSLGTGTAIDPVALQLRALYSLYPNNDLLGLIEDIDRGAASF